MTIRRPELELSWGSARGAALPELATIASSAGFQSISLRPAMYFEAKSEGFSDHDLQGLLADAGLVVGFIDPLARGLPGVPNSDSVIPELRSFVAFTEEDCFTAAEGVGAEAINLAQFLGGPQRPEHMADVIGKMCEHAAERGIRMSMEFMPNSGIPDLGVACDLVQRVGAPNLGVMFDTWHFFRSGGSIEQLANLPPDLVIGLQVSDATADSLGSAYVPMTDRLLPGDGILPLARVIGALIENNPSLRVGAEVFQNRLRRMGPEPSAHSVAAAMQPILDELSEGT
jgi:sugar phosphate isomerase/epimerase